MILSLRLIHTQSATDLREAIYSAVFVSASSEEPLVASVYDVFLSLIALWGKVLDDLLTKMYIVSTISCKIVHKTSNG